MIYGAKKVILLDIKKDYFFQILFIMMQAASAVWPCKAAANLYSALILSTASTVFS
mgnify:CR=1 FL=1